MRQKKQQYNRFGQRFFQPALLDRDGVYVPHHKNKALPQTQSQKAITGHDTGDECTNSKKLAREHADECTNTHSLRSKL